MSSTTTNYNLVKPDYTDIADIADINGNSDIIDNQLKLLADGVAQNASDISELDSDVSADITALQSSVTDLGTNKQNATDDSLTTTSKQVVGAINELNTEIASITKNIAMGTVTASSRVSLESWLVDKLSAMQDGEVRIYYLTPNFASDFFGGAAQVAIASRKQNGVYRVAYPNVCGDAYYYSSAWHYTKATMSSVTP